MTKLILILSTTILSGGFDAKGSMLQKLIDLYFCFMPASVYVLYKFGQMFWPSVP